MIENELQHGGRWKRVNTTPDRILIAKRDGARLAHPYRVYVNGKFDPDATVAYFHADVVQALKDEIIELKERLSNGQMDH